MITANNMTPVGFQFGESDFEIALMEAMARATSKYNTSVTLEPNTYSLAPIVISDATLVAGCDVSLACSVPSVLKNTRIQMNEACKICLTDLSEGEFEVYGIDPVFPEPTTELENQKAREQAVQLTFSGLKTYWLGDVDYIAADLLVAAKLAAYTKDDGQWKKILAASPAHVTITQNAALTLALQNTMTYDQALAYLDAVIDAQSLSMQMITNSAKTAWLTVRIFDIIQAQRQKNELAGIRFVAIENEFGNFDSFVYRDIQWIKYEHFSAAIADFATGVADTQLLPHRIILTVGLPMLSFPKPVDSSFRTQFYDVSKRWEAGTMLTIMHPEAVDGDYYVVAY
jgi:hypothetical protein